MSQQQQQQQQMTPAEQAFCMAHARYGNDPVRAYLETIGGGAEELSYPDGEALGALLERNDIRLEVWFQQRLRAATGPGAVLVDLEEARLKALDMGDAALAAEISVYKGLLTGALAWPNVRERPVVAPLPRPPSGADLSA